MMKEIIESLVFGNPLTEEQAADVMRLIMEGEVTPAQFGALAAALRLKGETVDELAGFAKAMRAKAIPVATTGMVVDTCGTGGDHSGSFNISTAAAFVAAGAGLKVAKHGNRAASSACGSADVLEALGVRFDLDAEGVSRCIEEVGIGFMFAPLFHPAMKQVAALRRELGIRTVFNILGPLTNPANVKAQVIGVSEPELVPKLSEVLRQLGCQHALVVHGEDGLDELTLSGRTQIAELRGDNIAQYSITPEELGLKRASLKELKGGTAEENAKMLLKILNGEKGALYDIVALNAAAAIVAGDKAENLREGLELARESMESKNALQKLRGFVELSQELAIR
jgi:anthranilate phosphoribosyltransferase